MKEEAAPAEKDAAGEVPKQPLALEPYEDPEIVIGLVGPVGVDLQPVVDALKEVLLGRYSVDEIRLSAQIAEFFSVNFQGTSEHKRIHRLMHLGTKLRKETSRGDAVALLGVEEIQRVRREDRDGEYKAHAYILRSLKTPKEIQTLRNIYGRGFFAISVYSPRETRVALLADRIANSRHGLKKGARALAERLVEIDELEDEALGQDVQDAFPLGDLFVYTHNSDDLRKQIRRFIYLIFGNRFQTPTREEHGMQIAKSAALRSADMNRQVGAAIVNDEGDVLAIGCNDVPKSGGGFYWPDEGNDQRDFRRGRDSMAVHREQVLAEFLARLKDHGLLDKNAGAVDTLVRELISGPRKGVLKGTQGMNILEFGRSVHAEMAALTTAARLGTAVKGATLYCTTFPCHICARHIVASGISRVIYVEPYPKSKAKQLHEDSVSVDPQRASGKLVNFEPFQGIAPARYFELFDAGDLRKGPDGVVPNWNMSTASPRFTRFMNSYAEIEELVTATYIEEFRRKKIDATMPPELLED